MIGQIEIAHLAWAIAVANFLLDPNAKKLTVETDPQLCDLGKKIHDPESMQRSEQLAPGFGKVMDKIRKPHDELHASAIQIQEMLNRYDGDRSLAQAEMNEIYATKTIPSLQGIDDVLKEVTSLVEKQVVKKEKELKDEIADIVRNIIITLVVALLIGIIISYLISKMRNYSAKKNRLR